MSTRRQSCQKKQPGFLAWSEDIGKQPLFKFNEEDVNLTYQCILCKNNVQKIKENYAWKLVNIAISYSENGTSHMLQPNFEYHFSSAGHVKCSEIATGKSTNIKSEASLC